MFELFVKGSSRQPHRTELMGYKTFSRDLKRCLQVLLPHMAVVPLIAGATVTGRASAGTW